MKGSSSNILRALSVGREDSATTATWSPTFESFNAIEVSPRSPFSGTISTCSRASAIATLLLQSAMNSIATLMGDFIPPPAFFHDSGCVINIQISIFQPEPQPSICRTSPNRRLNFRTAIRITFFAGTDLQDLLLPRLRHCAELGHHRKGHRRRDRWTSVKRRRTTPFAWQSSASAESREFQDVREPISLDRHASGVTPGDPQAWRSSSTQPSRLVGRTSAAPSHTQLAGDDRGVSGRPRKAVDRDQHGHPRHSIGWR